MNPTERAREAIEIVCSGAVAQLDDYYSANFIDHVNGAVYEGHDGLMQSYALYKSLFTEWRFTVEEQLTEGNRVASRWVLRGSRHGRPLELRGMTISSVGADGLITEDWGYSDSWQLVRQLGLIGTLRLALDVVVGRVKLPKPPEAPARGARGSA